MTMQGFHVSWMQVIIQRTETGLDTIYLSLETRGIIRHDPTFTAPTSTDKDTEISVIREEYFVKLVTCPQDKFDTTFEEFKDKFKKAGYDQIITARTEYYNKAFAGK